MSSRRKVVATAGALALVLVLTAVACGERPPSSGVSAQEGRRYLIDQFHGMWQTLDTLPPLYKTLDEVVPTVEYVYPDGSRRPGADLVVVGRIVAVEKGIGFRVPGEDHPSGVPTDFDDERSKWRTIHATVAVEHGIGRQAPDRLRIALPLYDLDKFDHMAAGLPALGRVVLFLDEGSPLASYDRSLYIVGNQHSLVATVAPDGTLALPLLLPEQAAPLLAPVRTLAELEAKAKAPRTIVLIPGPDGGPTRAPA